MMTLKRYVHFVNQTLPDFLGPLLLSSNLIFQSAKLAIVIFKQQEIRVQTHIGCGVLPVSAPMWSGHSNRT